MSIFAKIFKSHNPMTEWEQELSTKLSRLSEAEFDYKDTKDINEASNIDYGATGVYMEASIIYFEIKNLPYLLKEHGRRKAAQVYTMYKEVLTTISSRSGAFVNCFAPNAFLIVFPGKEESIPQAVEASMRIVQALSETYKNQFTIIPGIEFAMGLDHGHIMGTKNKSDNGLDSLTWFGSCIYKAMRISRECSRPFYIGVSGSIYHSLSDDLRISERRILGIKKKVEIWTKITYQYENVKKHLYQTNHKIPLDEA